MIRETLQDLTTQTYDATCDAFDVETKYSFVKKKQLPITHWAYSSISRIPTQILYGTVYLQRNDKKCWEN